MEDLNNYASDPYLVERFEDYISQCKCTLEDGCYCDSFEDFCDEVIQTIKEDLGEQAYYDSREDICSG